MRKIQISERARIPTMTRMPTRYQREHSDRDLVPILGIGIEPVDCSPPAIIYVNSAKALKRIWRHDRHMYPGLSLKQYARDCRAGREWLARKGQR